MPTTSITGPGNQEILDRIETRGPSKKNGSGDDIAIGIEFKFLVPFVNAGEDDPFPEDGRPLHRTEYTPESLQRHAFSLVADTISTVAGQAAVSKSDIEKLGCRESDYWKDHWIVKKSNSAEAPDGKSAYRWVPIEICSPKLRTCDPNTFSKVRAVIAALNTGYRLEVNYSCELHLHLGRMDSRPFTLPALKNLASLFWLAEPTLRSVKDPRSPNFHHKYTWAFPLRKHSRLAKSPPQGSSEMALDYIRAATDSESLGRLLSGDEERYRRLGFNFSAFGLEDDRAKRSPRTIEVRFLEGCGSGTEAEDEVTGWMKIYTTLVRLAVKGPQATFNGILGVLLEEAGGGEMQDAVRVERFARLLKRVGVEEGVITLFTKMVERNYSPSH